MMVTFISQCEKNALNKTRRVLDAFADRIGNNTWQTLITEDGLQTVGKMLRQTASRSTAVSCHWIRSRSRSQLLWVVGRKSAFNAEGAVPVNYTSKEVIMDKLPIQTNGLLANTGLQPLSHHLFAVGFVAQQLLKNLHIDSEKIQQAAFIAGILHDIGKIDPQFQGWLNKKLGKTTEDFIPEDGVHIDSPTKFSFEKHPRHQEISWVLAKSLIYEDSTLNDCQREQIAHGIYWHHTKPFRKDDKFTNAKNIYRIFKSSLQQETFEDIYSKAYEVLSDVISLAKKFDLQSSLPEFSKTFNLPSNPALPDYKKYDDIAETIEDFQSNVRTNALHNLVRTSVISADRLVSSCLSDDLEAYLSDGSLYELLDRNNYESNTLTSAIEQCLQGFESIHSNSKRNEVQSKAAISLANLQKIASINDSANIGVLQGPAGCGKTKIALEWAMKTDAKKIIWICPRVQVCLGIVHDLITSQYLPNNRIEIFTGEYKKILCGSDDKTFDNTPDSNESDYFTGDIVITTIDQVVNSIRSHGHVDTFIHFMNAHVVFDEFHELVTMLAFNLLFAELIEAKKQQGKHANTLLVSATPHYLYTKDLLGIDAEDIISIKSFNHSKYRIEFTSYDETEEPSPLLAESQQERTFVITNTALDAQLGYLQHHTTENSILLHSKYTKQDKAHWFNQVFDSFKQNGSQQYAVLRSGPIMQASLNITCNKMLTELSSPENWLQRLGRLDRFGENSGVNPYITVLPKSIEESGKLTSSCAKFLNQLCVWQSTKAWLTFLKDKLDDNNVVQLDKLYWLYQAFYNDKQAMKCLEQDFIKALKASVKLINNKVIDPISVPPKSKWGQGGRGVVKISANSLRGDNRFVQMAVCEVKEDLTLNITEDYACDETFNEPTLTASIEAMRGYGEDDNNLVQFMRKKHHNIKKEQGVKKARNEWELIKQARSPDNPIYLSYTPNDLNIVKSEPHTQSVYYITSNKQPVGAMSLARFKQSLQPETAE